MNFHSSIYTCTPRSLFFLTWVWVTVHPSAAELLFAKDGGDKLGHLVERQAHLSERSHIGCTDAFLELHGQDTGLGLRPQDRGDLEVWYVCVYL